MKTLGYMCVNDLLIFPLLFNSISDNFIEIKKKIIKDYNCHLHTMILRKFSEKAFYYVGY